MKKTKISQLLIIILLLSFISTACKSEEEMFVEEAINHMRSKYGTNFSDAYMYDGNKVIMSRNGNAAVRVVAEYNDFGDDGTKEWGDNYIYYLHMDEIYKDTKEVIDTVYENSKIYIHINKITNNFDLNTDIIELYKRGTFNIYVYTDKDMSNREEDVLKIKQGMNDKQMYCIVDIIYLREKDFNKMSEDKINIVSGNGIYNASTFIIVDKKDQEIRWKYGDFKKDLE